MKISLTKLFAQDGKSEKYEIPLTSETFSIGGQDYRVIEKHPVILGLTHAVSYTHLTLPTILRV